MKYELSESQCELMEIFFKKQTILKYDELHDLCTKSKYYSGPKGFKYDLKTLRKQKLTTNFGKHWYAKVDRPTFNMICSREQKDPGRIYFKLNNRLTEKIEIISLERLNELRVFLGAEPIIIDRMPDPGKDIYRLTAREEYIMNYFWKNKRPIRCDELYQYLVKKYPTISKYDTKTYLLRLIDKRFIYKNKDGLFKRSYSVQIDKRIFAEARMKRELVDFTYM